MLPVFTAGIHIPVGLNYNQMEHLRGEQYSEYPVERNPRAYMSMRDYRNKSWQSQQPVERNPNEYRSMRDYRNQWMSSPYGSAYNHSWGNHTNSSWEPRPPQYAPPEPPYYAPTSQQQQPPTPSPVEQAILNLSKLVDNFIEEQRAVTVQANQETEIVESSLNKELDGFQSEIGQKYDILQESISKLTNQLVHQEKENPEEVCLSDTMVEEQCLQQLQEGLVENFESSDIGAAVCLWEKKEAIPLLLTKEAVEEHKENNLPLPPTNSVYILPSLASQSQPKTPEAPSIKATPSLPILQNFRKLVATVKNLATTSKTLAVAYVAWHSGWFGCWFEFGTPEPRHF